MKRDTNILSTLVLATESYVAETLHTPLKLYPWAKVQNLPLYLRNAYEFQLGSLRGREVLWLFVQDESTPQKIEKHMVSVGEYWGNEMVVVFKQIPSYVRQRLMQRAISFVAPGAQLYLPAFGLDFRSRAKQPVQDREWLRPSAQAMLLYLLIHSGKRSMSQTRSELAPILGQTLMTASRAVAELKAHGFLETQKNGRTQQIHLCAGPKEIWDTAQNVLRNPVKRRLTITGATTQRNGCLLAGLNALSRRTMLAEPRTPTYATSAKAAKDWIAQGGGTVEDQPSLVDEPGTWIAEVWSYDPAPLSSGTEVDPLSLFLSLREDLDDRVQGALRELLEGLDW